jgi:hypothetical protein
MINVELDPVDIAGLLGMIERELERCGPDTIPEHLVTTVREDLHGLHNVFVQALSKVTE